MRSVRQGIEPCVEGFRLFIKREYFPQARRAEAYHGLK